MDIKARLSRLEKLNTGTDWAENDKRMNRFFEATGLGIQYENGIPVQRPELAHPAPNRSVEDFS